MHRAAIFDMDGLLIDSERSIMDAWLEEARRIGVQLSECEYKKIIGRAARESDAILIAALGGKSNFEHAHSSVRRTLEMRVSSSGFALKPGAKALLAELTERDIPCAVASSSSRLEVGRRLAKADVLKHFACVAGGDEVARGKPDPSIYLLAASRLGVRPESCIAFEDSHNGSCAALASGTALVIVPDLVHPLPEVISRSMFVLSSLDEAIPHVGKWFSEARAA